MGCGHKNLSSQEFLAQENWNLHENPLT
jgi:hypothetical protein